MPFELVDPIKEARELQEMFKDDPEAVEKFKQYELAHIETERIMQEGLELRNKLVEIRKKKNITEKELELKTGMSEQDISRMEIGNDFTPNLASILKYAEAIGCKIIPVDE
ncbi:MAG: helix-turn-helix transcriptional regulator [Oscillospiraceae bacterium]|nr:helix-turn-helix transcriptional regulator [Oscillospiraceae bacterium]